jgi:hypothetical protein
MTGPAGLFNGVSPWSGRVTAIAPNPSNANIIYIGSTNGGVWKTTNGGKTWAPLTDGLPTLAIGSLALDPQNSNVVYAGTGEDDNQGGAYYGEGLFKSIDAGLTWSKLAGTQFDGCHIGQVSVDPANSQIILVATDYYGGIYPAVPCPGGVWRTIDGGAHWAHVMKQASTQNVFSKVGDPTTWFASVSGDGLYRSTNTGASFTELTGSGLPTTAVERITMASSPTDGDRLYAAFTYQGFVVAIDTSPDGGTTWSQLPSPPNEACNNGCWANLALAVDPNDPLAIYFAGVNMYRYGGGTWTATAAGYSGIHVDFHAIAFDASKRLLVGNDGGFYRSTNSGASFSDLNTSLAITQHYQGAAGSLNGPLLSGTQDNGTARYTGKSWAQLSGGDGGPAAIDAATKSTWYVTFQDLGIYRMTNNGKNLTEVDGGIDSSDPRQFIAPIAVAPNAPSRLYGGTNRLWVTTDHGDTWNPISPAFTGNAWNCCITAIAPTKTSGFIYVGTGDGHVWLTEDNGTTWNDVSLNGAPNIWVSDIWVNPTNANDVYVGLSGYGNGTGHVWHSTNAGTSWSDVSGNLPDAPANSIVVDTRTTPATIYAGTDFGVLSTTDGGTTWTQFGSGLPATVVLDLLLDPITNRLVAGTYGRSAWTAVLPVATAGTVLVDVTDAGFAPTSTSLALGKLAIWSFPPANTATHGTTAGALGLWTSGARSADSAYGYAFTNAGTYTVSDIGTANTSTLAVSPTGAPQSGTTATHFTITWASANVKAGYVVDVEVQRPGASGFVAWQTGVRTRSASFTPDAGAGSYAFHARLRKTANSAATDWSPTVTVSVS